MSLPPLHSAALAVLLRYPAFCRQGTLIPLGNRGGFSGADLWRIDGPANSLCLRAWPPRETWPRLLFRHRLMTMARQHGLPFVPAIFNTLDGTTGVENAGRLWELTEWLPGCADYHEHPSLARLEVACMALAHLHTVWRSIPGETAICPAVRRRLDFLDEWHRLLGSGWRPLDVAGRADPLVPLVERAWRRLPDALEAVPRRLQRWVTTSRRSQPCLCDLWHDHLLFEGDRLTGIIDYGAAKLDHVTADLARLLGSLVGDDAAGWQAGLQAYRRFAPLDAEEEELAHLLDETGTILGVANWLRWLYEEKRSFADLPAVARRFGQLVERLEHFHF
jgi:homoserine kinase type II